MKNILHVAGIFAVSLCLHFFPTPIAQAAEGHLARPRPLPAPRKVPSPIINPAPLPSSGASSTTSITGINPASGQPGTTVSITGNNFSATPANNIVRFNGIQATVISATDRTLVVQIPAGASSGPVTVTVIYGAATYSNNFLITANGPPVWTPIPNPVVPAPGRPAAVAIISSILPSGGSVGTLVNLSGRNFDNMPANNNVKFNGVQATVLAADSNTLTVKVPAGATSGTVTVTTQNGTARSPGNFTVIDTAVKITGISPLSGTVGATLVITGANFSTSPANNIVRFNGVQAAVKSATATSLAVTVPNGATSGFVSVQTASSSASSPSRFDVVSNTTGTLSGGYSSNEISLSNFIYTGGIVVKGGGPVSIFKNIKTGVVTKEGTQSTGYAHYWKNPATGQQVVMRYTNSTKFSGTSSYTTEYVSFSGVFELTCGISGNSSPKCTSYGINLGSSARSIQLAYTPALSSGNTGRLSMPPKIVGTLNLPSGVAVSGGSSSGGANDGGSGTPPSGKCGMENYSGPKDDPQTWTFCATAYSYKCNGNASAAAKTCSVLDAMLRSGSKTTAARYCPNYCK